MATSSLLLRIPQGWRWQTSPDSQPSLNSSISLPDPLVLLHLAHGEESDLEAVEIRPGRDTRQEEERKSAGEDLEPDENRLRQEREREGGGLRLARRLSGAKASCGSRSQSCVGRHEGLLRRSRRQGSRTAGSLYDCSMTKVNSEQRTSGVRRMRDDSSHVLATSPSSSPPPHRSSFWVPPSSASSRRPSSFLLSFSLLSSSLFSMKTRLSIPARPGSQDQAAGYAQRYTEALTTSSARNTCEYHSTRCWLYGSCSQHAQHHGMLTMPPSIIRVMAGGRSMVVIG